MAADPTPTTVGIIEAKITASAQEFYAEVDRVRSTIADLKRDSPHVRVEVDTGEAQRRLDEVQQAEREVDRTRPRVVVEADTGTAQSRLDVVLEAEREVGRTRPRVTVVADTGDAQRRLAEVTAAEDRLAAATRAHERANALALLAEQRLEEVRGRRGRTDLQVATAEEALRYAVERSDLALEKAIVAEDLLEAARKKAARAALEAAAAAEADGAAEADDAAKTLENAAAHDTAAKSMADAGGQAQWLALAILGLGPGLVPLAAGAVGAAGALAGMGAAGVLAVLGIRREMALGTATGEAYHGWLATLQTDLHLLEGTATRGLLPGFEQAAEVAQTAMPALNAEVAMFTGQLGRMLPAGLDAVVTLLTRAQPLLQQGGDYLVGWVQGLDGFAHSDAFQQFINYAIAEMPQVATFMHDLLSTAGAFLAAMAPYGQGVLTVVDGALRLVSALSPIAPLVWGVATAVVAVNTAGRLIDGVTAAMARLGLASTATAAEVAAVGEAEAVVATEGAAAGAGGAAAGAGTGGAGTAAAGGVAGLLARFVPGAVAAAGAAELPGIDAFGIEKNGGLANWLSTWMPQQARETGFAMDASGIVGSKVAGTAGQTTANSDQALAGMVSGGQGAKAAGLFGQVAQAANANAISLSRLKALYPQYAAAVAAAGGAQAAERGNTNTATAAFNRQVDALDALAAAQLAAAQQGQSLETTEDKYRDDLALLVKGLQGKSHSLNQDTAAGRANREQTAKVTSEILAHASAINSDGKHAADARKYVVAHAQALEQQMIKAGADRTAVVKLVGALLDVSKTHPVSKVDVETAAARAVLADLRNRIEGMNGLTANVYVHAVATGASPSQIAADMRNAAHLGLGNGGYAGGTAGSNQFGVPGLAGGGSGYTVRGPGSGLSDTAGLFRLADGEEVVSNRNGQAATWRPLLKAISAGRVRPGDLGGPRTVQVAERHVHVGGVHFHNPVQQDPVAAAQDAADLIQAYAGMAA